MLFCFDGNFETFCLTFEFQHNETSSVKITKKYFCCISLKICSRST